jgi:hypothetical protein
MSASGRVGRYRSVALIRARQRRRGRLSCPTTHAAQGATVRGGIAVVTGSEDSQWAASIMT